MAASNLHSPIIRTYMPTRNDRQFGRGNGEAYLRLLTPKGQSREVALTEDELLTLAADAIAAAQRLRRWAAEAPEEERRQREENEQLRIAAQQGRESGGIPSGRVR